MVVNGALRVSYLSPHQLSISRQLLAYPMLEIKHYTVTGPHHALVREEVLHGEPRVQVRVLLPLHPPHRAAHTRPRRQDLHQVSRSSNIEAR